MGEEGVKTQQQQEEPKVEVEETKKEEEPARPCPHPPHHPFVLFVDLHCTGCAKKIQKSLMRIRGVEGVSIDMAKNEVSIKGVVDPEVICAKITNKTKRVAKLLSQHVNSQVGGYGLKVVELNVNMHCEACAHQLKQKILKMRGVQTASTELSTGKVVVTGTMDENKLVEYVYRRTKKQARIVPQPEPPQQESKPTPEESPAPAPTQAPAPPEPNKEDDKAKTEEQTVDPNNSKELEQQPNPPTTTTAAAAAVEEAGEPTAEMKPSSVEVKAGEGGDEIMVVMNEVVVDDHENMKRMMYQYNYQYQPLYVMEPIPPPQLFSDENPNACCIL